jgi:hypothetical protein
VKDVVGACLAVRIGSTIPECREGFNFSPQKPAHVLEVVERSPKR